MSLSIAMLVNDRLLQPCVCREVGDELASLRQCAAQVDAPDGLDPAPSELDLGVGHYHEGEALLTRRPLTTGDPAREPHEDAFGALFCAGRSTCTLAHAMRRSARAFQPNEVQPFRFRDWLWVMSGDLEERPDFDHQSLAIPPYIRGNMRTWRPAEVAFHLFLAFLHRTATLETFHWDRMGTRRALSSAISILAARYVAAGSGASPSYSILTTNGEMLLGVGVGRQLFVRRLEGLADCRLCGAGRRPGSDAAGSVAHEHLKAILVADPAPAAPDEKVSLWRPLKPGRLLEIDAGLGIEEGPLTPHGPPDAPG